MTCTGDAATGYTLTNSYTPETTEVSGSKTWDDANNQDGKRPASITIHLLANGKKLEDKELTVTADDGWKWEFKDLPKYENGKEITYTITEDAVPDYTIEINGYDVTNSYTPGKTSVTVTKSWNDADNQDGKRPDSIQVQLYADGKAQGEPVVLNDENYWSHTWSELDEKSAGNTIKYTVKEVGETGGKIDFNGAEYEVACTGDAASGYTITNSYTPEKTSVPVTKNWRDNNDQDGIRPKVVTVKLLADGEDTGKTLALNKSNNWSGSFTDLAKYKDGVEISYTVEEAVVDGYEVVIEGNMTAGYVITNSHIPETTEVSGSKTWDDANNQDGKRPTSITINLLANGVQKESKKVTEEDNWSWSFTNLPKYENGAEITYTITEDAVPDYTIEIDGYDVINSYTPGKTSVTVTKSWNDADNQDGKRPENIEVQLYADGKAQGEPVVLNDKNHWSHTWSELDEKSAGNTIKYTVKEVGETGGKIDFNGAEYEVACTGDAATGYTLTNSYTPETTEVSGSKTWDDANNQDGKRPESIKINLLANGEKVDEKTVSADDNWSWSFTNLPKYENGTAIVYTITEDAVPDYTTEINGYDVINSYTPGKTSVTVTKSWSDADNQDGKRPENIEVQLYADGKAQGEPVVLNAGNNWSHIWSELDEKSAGNTIEYTVKEVGETGGKIDFNGAEYQVAYTGDAASGYTIVNSYTTEKVEVSGSKTWQDKGNEGARPESITIRLYADNKEIDRASVTAENDWSWSFENLPKYRDGGQEIIYTISEDAVDNYITEVDGYNVTNKYQSGATSVSVAKRWDDSGNRDGKRPDSVKVQLYADGEKVGDPVTLNKSNDWRYTWSELDEQADGKEIAYTVKEVGENKGTIDFDGTKYKVTYTGNATKGYTITNSYNAVSTSVQTGDDTDVRSNLAVMFAAMAVAGAVLIFRRRRYNAK